MGFVNRLSKGRYIWTRRNCMANLACTWRACMTCQHKICMTADLGRVPGALTRIEWAVYSHWHHQGSGVQKKKKLRPVILTVYAHTFKDGTSWTHDRDMGQGQANTWSIRLEGWSNKVMSNETLERIKGQKKHKIRKLSKRKFVLG
jgi:hypothetical protein